ncbi:MAG: sensor histidine kinase [Pseudobdellovibrio sp.]
MKNIKINFYFQKFSEKGQIVLFFLGLLYLIISLLLQYSEKKYLLLEQANLAANMIRNDLLSGNQSYVYEQCRMLISQHSVRLVAVKKEGISFCDENTSTSIWPIITVTIPIKYNPKNVGTTDLNTIGTLTLGVDGKMILFNTLGLVSFLVLIMLGVTIFFRKVYNEVNSRIVKPISLLAEYMMDPAFDKDQKKIGTDSNIDEVIQLYKSYDSFVEAESKVAAMKLEATRNQTLLTVAQQVAHDIRSPLSALSMIIGTLSDVSEEKRLIIRTATQRINDIANDLLLKSKTQANSRQNDTSTHDKQNLNQSLNVSNEEALNIKLWFLPTLVDELVSEKRFQYMKHSELNIDVDLSQSVGVFSLVDERELKRVLSNLINNAVEALSEYNGCINVGLIKLNCEQVELFIHDNGKGIPKHLMSKLGKERLSNGKEISSQSGNGLGLYHAKKTIEKMNGKFEIHSIEGKGTTIKMILPLSKSPDWFAEQINLKDKKYLVSLDDDASIHNIWSERIKNCELFQSVEHIKFQSHEAFEKHVLSNMDQLNKSIYLVDYELINQKKTGLDVIEELALEKYSILITSHYDEPEIQKRAEALKLKILPKSLAGFVPFK